MPDPSEHVLFCGLRTHGTMGDGLVQTEQVYVHSKVLVVDDVISAGTAFTAASRLIEQAGARVSALVVGLDRQERGTGDGSARSDIERTGVSVVAVASLDDLITTLEGDGSDSGPKAGPESLSDMLEYRTRYGA